MNAKPAFRQRPAAVAPAANAVAVIAPPRLPYTPTLEEKYGINEEGWRTLTEAIYPAAKTIGAIQLALDYCKHRKLDIFKRPVHIVPIWNAAAGKEVETVWPGIADHRTTAMRTGNYAGMDMPVFGPEKTETFAGRNKKWVNGAEAWEDETVEVTYPEWCQITLYRLLHGQRVPFPGPKVYWLEYYARKSRWTPVPNEMWQKRASGQLEKCAEAGALRRAFPEELGDEWTMEEAGAFQTHAPVDITTEGAATVAEPQRADFVERPAPEPPPAKNWSIKIEDDDAAREAILDLVDTAASPDDLGEITKQNEARIAALPQASQDKINTAVSKLLVWFEEQGRPAQ